VKEKLPAVGSLAVPNSTPLAYTLTVLPASAVSVSVTVLSLVGLVGAAVIDGALGALVS
jgi:hypothetical protein